MEQKIIKSEELESCLAAIKKERNVHHALLVCGNSFRKQGLYQQLEDALKKEGMELLSSLILSRTRNMSLSSVGLRHIARKAAI